MHQILVVEDQPDLRAVLRTTLVAAGYRVVEAGTAARALVEARSHKPDLLLVDLGLPDGDGIDLIRAIRGWSVAPILVLSARTRETEKVLALDAGADDYVTKPFGTDELLARVRAALRRAPSDGHHRSRLVFGATVVDLERRQATGPAGEPVHLTPQEYRVLDVLARRPGLIVAQRQLLREAWGPDRVDDARGLRVFVKSLRDKLEPAPAIPRFILTEIGVGYRLASDVVEGTTDTTDS
ncbi:MAG: response regulator [Chromatiales bacterium]|jgi:two-component system KDP operon response regulator KdpE|nr:response regulator [Chromatiales bacterium]